MVDFRVGKYATAKGCMELLKHRRFIGCKIDTERFHSYWLAAVKVFARNMLRGKHDINGSENSKSFMAVFVKVTDEITARKRTIVWYVPYERYPTQTSQLRTTHIL